MTLISWPKNFSKIFLNNKSAPSDVITAHKIKLLLVPVN